MTTSKRSIAAAAIGCAGRDTRKLNPHIFGKSPTSEGDQELARDKASSPKRIRQSNKPLLNNLESEWLEQLQMDYPKAVFHAQAIRWKLANGSWYKPDLASFLGVKHPFILTCWECKGPRGMKNIDRGIQALKVAAHQWPEVRFVLVWRDPSTREWRTQEVLP